MQSWILKARAWWWLVLVASLGAGLFLGGVGNAGSGQEGPGSAGDPLVAQSYVDEQLAVRDQALQARVQKLQQDVARLSQEIDLLQRAVQ